MLFLTLMFSVSCSNDKQRTNLIGFQPNIDGNQIDFVDFVIVNDYLYEEVLNTVTVKNVKVSKQIGMVKRTISELSSYQGLTIQDGDASFLPKGTLLYSVNGSTNIIAAKKGKKYKFYQYTKETQQ